jgi:hypothetical protein
MKNQLGKMLLTHPDNIVHVEFEGTVKVTVSRPGEETPGLTYNDKFDTNLNFTVGEVQAVVKKLMGLEEDEFQDPEPSEIPEENPELSEE